MNLTCFMPEVNECRSGDKNNTCKDGQGDEHDADDACDDDIDADACGCR